MVGMNEINRRYQLINSYGVIGDCHSVVFVSPDGLVDWGCLLGFDSPTIFCRLLDAEHGGCFQIAPVEEGIPGTQRYLPGSNVFKTHFTSIASEIVLTDFMLVETLSAWPCKGMNNNTWIREDGSCHCLVCVVEGTRGRMSVAVSLKITPNYVAAPCEILLIADNLGALIESEQQHMALGVN